MSIPQNQCGGPALPEQKPAQIAPRVDLLNEFRLERVLSALEGGMWEWNLQTGDVFYGDGWIKMIGFERAQVLRNINAWQALLHPDDLTTVMGRVRSYLEGRTESYQSTHRLRHRSGEWILVLDRGQIVSRDEQGRPLRMVGHELNITGISRVQQDFYDSEERYRLLLENLPDAVFVHENGVYIYANPAALDLVGAASSRDVLGRSIWSQIPADLHGMISERIEYLKRTGQPTPPIELPYFRMDGSTLRVEARATPCRIEGRACIQVIMRDVTQRYFAEKKLQAAYQDLDLRVRQRTQELELVNQSLRDEIGERKKAEKKMRLFQTAFEHAGDAVAILDAPLKTPGINVLYINPAFSRMTCYQPDEIIGQSAAGDAYFGGLVSSLAHTGQALGETLGRRKDGAEFSLEWSVSPVHDESGQPTEYVTIQRDISARKQAEEKNRRHQDNLAHILRRVTLDEMSTVLAHEINQPLGAIINFTDGVVRRLEASRAPDATMIAALQQVVAQAGRAAEIIARIRRSLHKSGVEFVEISLPELIRNTLHLMEGELREKAITLACDVSDGLPAVKGDAIQIEQVFLNLLRNAVSALSESHASRLLTVSASVAESGHVQISVTDNGPGVPPGDVEKIFEAFYTTRRDGLGMGLSISRSIIESHAGKLWCSRVPTGGAMFSFTLPAYSQAAPSAAAKSNIPAWRSLA